MKKLPTSIQLFGQTIKVEQVENLIALGERFGDWDHKTNTIRIQAQGHGQPDDITFQSFFHEQAHAILELAGHSDWSANEQFVELLGQLMYQAEQSRKYT